MSLFAVAYSCRSLSYRSRPSVNFVHSIWHRITALLAVVNFFVCHIEPLGTDGNKIDTDSDSDSDTSKAR